MKRPKPTAGDLVLDWLAGTADKLRKMEEDRDRWEQRVILLEKRKQLAYLVLCGEADHLLKKGAVGQIDPEL